MGTLEALLNVISMSESSFEGIGDECLFLETWETSLVFFLTGNVHTFFKGQLK